MVKGSLLIVIGFYTHLILLTGTDFNIYIRVEGHNQNGAHWCVLKLLALESSSDTPQVLIPIFAVWVLRISWSLERVSITKG